MQLSTFVAVITVGVVTADAASFAPPFTTKPFPSGFTLLPSPPSKNCTWTEVYGVPFVNGPTQTLYEGTLTATKSVNCHGCHAITSSNRDLRPDGLPNIFTTWTNAIATATRMVCNTSKASMSTPTITRAANGPPVTTPSSPSCTSTISTKAICPNQTSIATEYLSTTTFTAYMGCGTCDAVATKTVHGFCADFIIDPTTTTTIPVSTSTTQVCYG